MADGEEKVHPPTQRRREQARRDGQVARSNDLVAAGVLLAAMLLMQMTGPRILEAWKDMLVGALQDQKAPSIAAMFGAMTPLLLGVVLTAIAMNLIQVGVVFRAKLHFDALNPGKGLERIFSRRSIGSLAMNVTKFIVVAWVGWWSVGRVIDRIASLQQPAPAEALKAGGDLVLGVGIRIAVALLVLGAFDYAVRWWKHQQDLRMTRREVRDEMREMEIHQGLKQRRRELAAAMGRAK
jgi:flagellar biosynthesis protein FlhB